MANPDDLTDVALAVLEVTTSEQEVILDPRREYTLSHDGENTSGAEDTNTIYLATEGDVVADANEGEDKYKLKNGRFTTVGPDKTVLKFASASGSPTMSVSAGPVNP